MKRKNKVLILFLWTIHLIYIYLSKIHPITYIQWSFFGNRLCMISLEHDFFKPGLLILIWNGNISKCCAIWSKRRQIPKLVFGVRTVPSKFLQISADYNEDDETRSILTILQIFAKSKPCISVWTICFFYQLV